MANRWLANRAVLVVAAAEEVAVDAARAALLQGDEGYGQPPGPHAAAAVSSRGTGFGGGRAGGK